jgi:hypothetical protein
LLGEASGVGNRLLGRGRPQGAYKRLIELGATGQDPIQDVGDGILIGAVHDPFGNTVGIIENPKFKIKEK